MDSFTTCLLKQRNIYRLSVASDLFLPGKSLDIYFKMEPDPLDNIMQHLALLVWLRVESMREYFSQCRRKAEKSVKNNMARETLKKHQPYKLNVGNLNKKCKELNIPFKGQKYTLVKMISEVKGEKPPNEFQVDYNELFTEN
ncbi:hypothetical protein OS493_008003 [Desmophyllum pertusum]|uniref:SAP domain-containing protein n=1 Tax=Desmophyllum pertusum TaxID=174260 RepID=A0A9W9YF10_9CNID|nr:hypothetical protein OS493_008003 [Desmophyllum pertusum]